MEKNVLSMDFANSFVTLGGEYFEVETWEIDVYRDGQRPGDVQMFGLRDVRSGRRLLIFIFESDEIKLNARYPGNAGLARINIVRRAFDSGVLNFDEADGLQNYEYRPLDMQDSDLSQQTLVSDSEIRQFMRHKAYWMSYMHPRYPGFPITFYTPEDLNYLGATEADVDRNVLRLKNQGMLDEVKILRKRPGLLDIMKLLHPKYKILPKEVLNRFVKPTEKLIAAYESTLNALANTGAGDALYDLPERQSATYRGPFVFISHSSKDAELALALIDLLRGSLALTTDQIRCSSVDGYRLPVGVNMEGKFREEVNASKVVVGLITPSSLASYYVMFELGARWGANLLLAPLLCGVKASELSGPLSLLNALSANNDAQLHQLVEDIANHLELQVQPAASYVRNITAVRTLVDAIANQ
jgi:hypothetical protein